jgi:hypothetical protein
MCSEVIVPSDLDGTDNLPDLSDEKREAELLDSFGTPDEKSGISDFIVFSTIIDRKRRDGADMREIAEDPGSLLDITIDEKYPDIKERELIASALFKKYLAPQSDFMQKYNELNDIYGSDDAANLSRTSFAYVNMQKVYDRVREVVDFLTLYNDLRSAKDEAAIKEKTEMDSLRESLESDRRAHLHLILRRFGSEQINIPQTEGITMSLREWAANISRNKSRTDLPLKAADDADQATNLFLSIFNDHFTQDDQKRLLDELNVEINNAHQELDEANTVILDHEPSAAEADCARRLQSKTQELELLTHFIRYIITRGESSDF